LSYSKESASECEKQIYEAVKNSLMEAEKLGMKTVAIPTISSGLQKHHNYLPMFRI